MPTKKRNAVPGAVEFVPAARFRVNCSRADEVLRKLALVLGAGLPAWAAALSAIRSHGEHNQIALRYGGQILALTRVERKFDRLSDDPTAQNPLRVAPLSWNSSELTCLALDTTSILTDEVHHWHSMLFTKEIEPA